MFHLIFWIVTENMEIKAVLKGGLLYKEMFTKALPSGIVKLKQQLQNSKQKQRLLKWHILSIGHYFVAAANHHGQFTTDKSLYSLNNLYLKDEYNPQNFTFPTQRSENITFIFYQIASSLYKKNSLKENKIFTYVKSH